MGDTDKVTACRVQPAQCGLFRRGVVRGLAHAHDIPCYKRDKLCSYDSAMIFTHCQCEHWILEAVPLCLYHDIFQAPV